MAIISEVAISLIFCSLFLGFVGQFMNIKCSKATEHIIDLTLAVFVFIVAYTVNLIQGADLNRYYQILNQMSYMGFGEAAKYGYYNDTMIINYFFWIIAKIGNQHLLPGISSIFVMFNLYYLIKITKKSMNLRYNVKISFVLLVFSIATVLAIATGVRQNWMVSVYAIAVYREFILKKRDTITISLYIASCMIHTSGILLVVIRLLSVLKGKYKLLLFFCPLFIPFLEGLATQQGLLGNAATKFFEYQLIGAEGLDVRVLLTKVSIMLVLGFMYVKVHNKSTYQGYMNYYLTLILVTMGFLSIEHIFSRLVNAVAYLSLPLLTEFYTYQDAKEKFCCRLILASLCCCLIIYHIVAIKNQIVC